MSLTKLSVSALALVAAPAAALQLVVAETKSIASGRLLGMPAPWTIEAAERWVGYRQVADWMLLERVAAACLIITTPSRFIGVRHSNANGMRLLNWI